ncbi:MAG: pantoate--beta-alanine ligase [Labilithrix sp.]|nr:pantoate--beta-alanine ligase [Labilithrix sp.]
MPGPIVLRDPEEVRRICDEARASGKRVGLVPTMGALHEGHLALVHEARRRSDFVVVTIFVNPTQFGPNEDLARYPRDLEGDLQKLHEADVVFAPDVAAMYPPGDETRVRAAGLAAHLCGPHRPVHFEGVATVVTKLFAIVGASTAVFGKKDFQQLAIIRRLVTDLFLPVSVVGHPIVREADGLAMSSRNAYLSADDRVRALSLSRGLSAAARAFGEGERRAGTLRGLVHAEVERAATSIDYVTLADVDTLTPIDEASLVGKRALLAIACRIGGTRLIDNLVLGEDPPPHAQP